MRRAPYRAAALRKWDGGGREGNADATSRDRAGTRAARIAPVIARLAAPLLLAAALAADAQLPPRLGGGFGRQGPTPTPVATPTPTPAPRPAPALPSSPVPTSRPTAAPTPPPTATPGPATVGSESTPHRTTASVSVGYVLVPFVATDLKGRSLRNLRREDVSLFVDGKPVPFDLFEKSENAPVSFTILLDGSGSMGLVGKMDGARAAIDALLETRRPGDDFALFVFAEGRVREAIPFTTDVSRIRRYVRDLVPFGKTALFDALARMPDQTLLGRNGLRAIVLLTDGIDNASSLTLEQLDELFSGVDVPVYPIGIRSRVMPADAAPASPAEKEKLMNLQILGDLARMSGGRIAIVDDPSRLPEAIADVERDLRSQYVIGFTPTGRGDVKFRRISLRIAGTAHRLRVRTGYRGTEPPERVVR